MFGAEIPHQTASLKTLVAIKTKHWRIQKPNATNDNFYLC